MPTKKKGKKVSSSGLIKSPSSSELIKSPSNSGPKLKFCDAKNDIIFKRVFTSHESITPSFLNLILRLGDDKKIEKLQQLSTECLPETSGAKKSIFDIMCSDQRGHRYIIEMQNSKRPEFLER